MPTNLVMTMTYDELLVEVERLDEVLTDSTGMKALLKVVKFHRLMGESIYCDQCIQEWPCATIQLIIQEIS